jgi:hypothetical protein
LAGQNLDHVAINTAFVRDLRENLPITGAARLWWQKPKAGSEVEWVLPAVALCERHMRLTGQTKSRSVSEIF